MPSSARLHDLKFTFAAVGADDPTKDNTRIKINNNERMLEI